MATARARLASGSAIFLLSITSAIPALSQTLSTEPTETFDLGTIVLTAEEQIKQALGASTISAEDLEKQPVVNDVAEIIRKMPGVNLSGTSPSGQRGNQRQVDIRGMGPENVLILIDGRPVLSRTSVKMGRSGERDTRGDTNWVPAEMVERIEVIRGPAAARYGSGAAGGVVNIITKAPDSDLLQLGMFFDAPESDLEGFTQRYNLLWAKRLNEDFALRFSGSYNRTEADDPDLNSDVETCETDDDGVESCSRDAGNEGVVNKDATLLLSWEPSDRNKFDFELGWSRQGNLFAGDTQLGGRLTDDPDSIVGQLADDGEETNVMERSVAAITHTGTYGWGSTRSYLQYEYTDNSRLSEGPAGGGEGSINSTSDWDTAILQAIAAKSEAYIDRSFFGRPAAMTLGAELRYETLDLSDYGSFSSITTDDGSRDSSDADDTTEQLTFGIYYEENIEWTDRLTLTPSVRFDHADTFGSNFSGGINATYDINSEWTVKGGVAKAFKAPTLSNTMSLQHLDLSNVHEELAKPAGGARRRGPLARRRRGNRSGRTQTGSVVGRAGPAGRPRTSAGDRAAAAAARRAVVGARRHRRAGDAPAAAHHAARTASHRDHRHPRPAGRAGRRRRRRRHRGRPGRRTRTRTRSPDHPAQRLRRQDGRHQPRRRSDRAARDHPHRLGHRDLRNG